MVRRRKFLVSRRIAGKREEKKIPKFPETLPVPARREPFDFRERAAGAEVEERMDALAVWRRK